MIRFQKIKTHPWSRFSEKLKKRIIAPCYAGIFTQKLAKEKKLRLISACEGEPQDGNTVTFYWLVDPEDGIIVDAAFQAYGESPLLGAADVACELVIRKTYEQARRLSADHLDKHVRDKSSLMAFPEEAFYHMNLVLFALEGCADQCMDIPLSDLTPPTPLRMSPLEPQEYPNWQILSHEQRLALIEEVLDEFIRPYIELDEGGVQIVELKNETVLVIAYSGNCTSCFAATGSTLSSIQQILQDRVHPELRVEPDLSILTPEMRND